MRCIKVTIGAAATQITTNAGIYASIICLQNNGSANMTIGDNTVTSTNGILLAPGTSPPGGSATFQMTFPRGTHLVDWWVVGTQGQILNVLYESSE